MTYEPDQEIREVHQMHLDCYQMEIEEEVTAFSLESHEDVWDEDNDQVVRALFFERGMSKWIVFITPNGDVKSTFNNPPRQLMTDVLSAMVAGGRI